MNSAMLRVENSRGGSAFLHEKLKVGDTLVISQPVNLFPFDRARPQAPILWPAASASPLSWP